MHELQNLMISKVAVGPMDNNAYLLRCRATDEQLLIDAANDTGTLLTLIGDDGIASVVTTHRHGDHWQALAEVVAATGARTYAAGRRRGHPRADRRPRGRRRHDPGGARGTHRAPPRGARAGSIALVSDDRHGRPHVFTGDCLFPGGVGDATKPKAFASLIHDVETKISTRWTRPGSTRGTATTRRWAPSGRAFPRSGAHSW